MRKKSGEVEEASKGEGEMSREQNYAIPKQFITTISENLMWIRGQNKCRRMHRRNQCQEMEKTKILKNRSQMNQVRENLINS